MTKVETGKLHLANNTFISVKGIGTVSIITEVNGKVRTINFSLFVTIVNFSVWKFQAIFNR